MNEMENRETRWLAYHLGDLSAEEHALVEAELRATPGEAEEFQRFIDSVKGWANRPTPHTPLEIEEIGLPLEHTPAISPVHDLRGRRRGFWPNAWTWGVAAMALLLFSLSQVRFSVTLGDSTLRWGAVETGEGLDGIHREIRELAGHLESLETSTAQVGGQVGAIAAGHLALQEEFRSTALQLLQNQRVETLTRFNDIKKLMTVAGIEYSTPRVWLTGDREPEGSNDG